MSEDPVKITAYVNKIAGSCQMQEPSLPEKLEMLKRWYVEHAGQPYQKVPVHSFAMLLVKKGLALDLDMANKTIIQRLPKKSYADNVLGLDDLNRMFNTAIFKESITEIVHTLEASEEMSLDLRISNFKRRAMMDGLNEPSNKNLLITS
jgi:hypothetical protein